MRCAIWCQSLFGICMVCLNACECMLTLFYTFMSFLSVCMIFQTGLSNVKRLNAIQTGNISNQMTFECCFQISQHHENCNAMSAFTVLRHVPRNTFICSAVQCCHQFVMVFIYCLLSFLVMQHIANSVSLLKLQENVQFSSVIFKNVFQDHYN